MPVKKKVGTVKVNVTRRYTIPRGKFCKGCSGLDTVNDFCDVFIEDLDDYETRTKKKDGPWVSDTEISINHKKHENCLTGCRNRKFHIGE